MIVFLKWTSIIALYILVVGVVISCFFKGAKMDKDEDEDN